MREWFSLFFSDCHVVTKEAREDEQKNEEK